MRLVRLGLPAIGLILGLSFSLISNVSSFNRAAHAQTGALLHDGIDLAGLNLEGHEPDDAPGLVDDHGNDKTRRVIVGGCVALEIGKGGTSGFKGLSARPGKAGARMLTSKEVGPQIIFGSHGEQDVALIINEQDIMVAMDSAEVF